MALTNVNMGKFSVNCMVQNLKMDFSQKLVVVYGSPYDEGKTEFIDELHMILDSWQGPILIGGDFNLSRFKIQRVMV
jgi:endonuclease/exonuclease/phosphatase (EEP) superfamily protein YafD